MFITSILNSLLLLTASRAQDFVAPDQDHATASPQNYSVMTTIKSDRNTWALKYWKPENRSLVNYAALAKVSDDTHQVVHAKFDLVTPHPTLNLNNVCCSIDCPILTNTSFLKLLILNAQP
jgi:hypothetical protein